MLSGSFSSSSGVISVSVDTVMLHLNKRLSEYNILQSMLSAISFNRGSHGPFPSRQPLSTPRRSTSGDRQARPRRDRWEEIPDPHGRHGVGKDIHHGARGRAHQSADAGH